MRLRTFTLLLLAVASVALAGNPPGAPPSGPKNGFRDLQWGSSPTADMVLISDSQGGTAYKRPSDKLSIGDAPVTSITYHYIGRKLVLVDVTFPFDAVGTLSTFLEGTWGPSLAEPMQPDYWKSEPTTAIVNCELVGARMDTCNLRFASNAALRNVGANEERRARDDEAQKRKAQQKKAATDL